MKLPCALLLLSLSALAWAGPIADEPDKGQQVQVEYGSADDEELSSDKKLDMKAFECVRQCQEPSLRCMQRCNEQPGCVGRCTEGLDRCIAECGIR